MTAISTNNISRHLGSVVDVNVKVRMPKAFLDYINEIVIKSGMADNIEEYCSHRILTGMLADHLGDWESDIVLKDYVMPPRLGDYEREIREYYL
jgi:glycosylphosphatidylinositol transamidase (GPIT) subunit GPI8